jgi:murein L,D-transpeptidase YcbB/YkuD
MRRAGRVLQAILLVALVVTASGRGEPLASGAEARFLGRQTAGINPRPSGLQVPPPQQLSAQGQAELKAIIQEGNLAELRWPDFSDYRKHLVKFYEAYGYSLPWTRGMQPSLQAREVIAILGKADMRGLSAEDYDASRWATRLEKLKPSAKSPTEEDAIHFDVAMTVCVMRYISDLHIGKVNPQHFEFGFNVETKKYDLPDLLREHIVDGTNVAAVLDSVEPPFAGYRREILALQTYMELAKKDDGEQLPPVKKTIAPGDSYPGLPRVIRLLRLVGDLPPDAVVPADSTVYQGALVDAVKKFQMRHGREADGRIGSQTIADLNVPLRQRVRQLQLTLERWRWLPLDLKGRLVVVNVPEFRLRAYNDQRKVELTMNVVVGHAYNHSTPLFIGAMEYVIFRPYWNVPYSIAKHEYFREIEKDPDYLAKKGFEVVDNRQNVVGSGTVTPDEFEQLRAGTLFVRQKPGPKNSLGLVKFIFPNNYDVYMHDTPATELFAKTRRDFSHGCIRLEHPADMAVWVLHDNPGNWDLEHIKAAMNAEKSQQVNLAHPIPVLIIYGTAVVPEDGLVHFYDDIYGHDASLEKVLDKGYPYPG